MRVDTNAGRCDEGSAGSPGDGSAAPAGEAGPLQAASRESGGRPRGTRTGDLDLEALWPGSGEIGARRSRRQGRRRAPLKACFDRLLPPRRDRAIAFSFPDVRRSPTCQGRPPCCRRSPRRASAPKPASWRGSSSASAGDRGTDIGERLSLLGRS